MSTTKKTLVDISCPDKVLRNRVFDQLLSLDILQASPVLFDSAEVPNNYYLQCGQGYHNIVDAVRQIRTSTNSIHISDGLLSEFFIKMQRIAESTKDPAPINAYRWLKEGVLDHIDIVHIHIRCMPGNDIRRMILSLLPNTFKKDESRERWIVFETPDVDAISKQIIECVR